MISDGDGKPESSKPTAEELSRIIELEMAQQRASWGETGARYRKLRGISFAFLALVILGALVAFFFFFTQVPQVRPSPGARSAPGASP